jgi:hypothetical protein
VSAAVVVLTAFLAPLRAEKPSVRDQQRLAARNARYYFASDVEDQINGLTQHRDEARDGLKVRGSFSYSDGFLRRQVIYEADENGYRIIRYTSELKSLHCEFKLRLNSDKGGVRPIPLVLCPLMVLLHQSMMIGMMMMNKYEAL